MGGRIAALDVLRGVAILGTFGTNVWAFTHPQGVTGFLAGLQGEHEEGLCERGYFRRDP